ncbi:MAG: DUF3048 domain-containing protein [Cryobacterium sp.]
MTNIPDLPRRPRSLALAAVLLPALLVTGCAGDVLPGAPPTPTSSDSAYTAPAEKTLSPLRGESVPAGSVQNPALSVKVDNHTAARPQVGLERADIVFEELVEGGLTRYVGVWQSDIPEMVGPVRSIRPMDPDIMSSFGGIAAYSGGAQPFLKLMRATPLVSVVFDTDTTGLFTRTPDRTAPHHVLLNAAEAVARNADLAPPAQQFAYAPSVAAATAVVDGTATGTMKTRFSPVRWPDWTWNAETSTYLRQQEGAPDLDADGAQLAATNVVVLRVDIDDTYGAIPKTTMIDSGEATVAAGGKSVSATWTKASPTAAIQLVDAEGVTVRLAPGNTWIELVPGQAGSVELLP